MMIAAYEGNLPYIFVSYAHKDSREVFDLIEKLSARGYRIWYDEGIEPGSEWPENIAEHLLRADMVLAMITNDSMASVNCRREINFAMSKNKPFLSVVLEKTDIPAGMDLQLSSQQSVLRYNFKDESRFLDKIESCSSMASCKSSPVPNGEDVPYVRETSPAESKRKTTKIPLVAAFAIIAAAIVLFLLIPKKAGDSGPGDKNESAVTTQDTSQGTGSTVATGTDSQVATDDTNSTAAEPGSSDSPAETAAKPDARWIYSVSETDTSLIYTFRSGPVIVMPISWNYRITTMEENNYFVFYHTSSRNSWHNEGYDHSGVLFSLGYSTTQDYKDFPSYSELGRTDDGYYFLMYPTDVQGYMNNERIYNDYREMWQEIDFVKKNSSFSMN